jgi:Gpi18-like mannosyltransferase
MIIGDLFIIYFVYRYVQKYLSLSKAKIAALTLTLYPPLLYNSALWGSGDSLINLFGLASIYFLYKKRFLSGALLFLISILYKSSLLIWTPLILLMVIKLKPSLPQILITLLGSALSIYFICLPFAPREIHPLFWFFNTMTQKILPGAMPQLTANAFNLWALFYGLPPRLDELLILPSLSARSLSLVICLILYLVSLIPLYRHFNRRQILLSITNLSLLTFVFMTRMHERYTFPALIPLLLLSLEDRRYLKYFLLLSFTHMLNVYNWWWYPSLPLLIQILKVDLIIRLLSALNIFIVVKLLIDSFHDKTSPHHSP